MTKIRAQDPAEGSREIIDRELQRSSKPEAERRPDAGTGNQDGGHMDAAEDKPAKTGR